MVNIWKTAVRNSATVVAMSGHRLWNGNPSGVPVVSRLTGTNRALRSKRAQPMGSSKTYREVHKAEIAAYQRAWHAAHPEKAAAYNRAWYAAHLEECKERDRKWRECHREERLAAHRIYNTAHLEERRAAYHTTVRVRRKADPEERRAHKRAYYEAHREESRARSRAYAKAHPQEMAEKERRRYALKCGATSGPINLEAIKVRDRMRCCICGRKVNEKLRHPHPDSLSFDHSHPLGLLGPHSQNNQRVAHLHCNKERGVGRLPVQMVLY